MKIVIIEDEPDTAEMYAEMMRISGYEVVKYYGGPLQYASNIKLDITHGIVDVARLQLGLRLYI